MKQSLTGEWGRFYPEEKLIWTRVLLLPHDFSLGKVWPWHTVWGRSLGKCQERVWKQNKLPAGLPARLTRKLPSGLPERACWRMDCTEFLHSAGCHIAEARKNVHTRTWKRYLFLLQCSFSAHSCKV